MRIVDAATIHPSIIQLLSLATSKEKVEIEYENYINFPNRTLFAFELEGETLGCIGVEISSLNLCEIKHIAVSSEQRGKGIGSKMISFILMMYPSVSAETDTELLNSRYREKESRKDWGAIHYGFVFVGVTVHRFFKPTK
ncbi:GNAT family N-acetyltransferase [Bacillus sp. 7884-1]|uniref:GNAT family N-acetyltransferase n=1 Tax=Bacillus sp. 7884-1 TaxID=2021693 RepID=UPI0015CEF125|nr:GNAT family N-acetyltransferase [Bacillus sp. 7884-1]